MSTHRNHAPLSDQARPAADQAYPAAGRPGPVAENSRASVGSANTDTGTPVGHGVARDGAASDGAASESTASDGAAGVGVATDGLTQSRLGNLFAQFVGFIGMGYGFSLFIHLIVLLLCSIIFFEEVGGSPLAVTISSVVDEQVGVEDFLDARIEIPEIEEAVDLPVDPGLLENPLAEASLPELGLGKTAGSKGGSDGGEKGLAIPIPASGKVVTKGSFTAWTVPNDPRPDQNYKIIIQIQLPERIKRYRSSDLTGIVSGTDKYRQRIPWDSRQRYPTLKLNSDGKLVRFRRNDRLLIMNHRVQLVIQVPASQVALVKDTIVIRSKILKEKQQLKIVF